MAMGLLQALNLPAKGSSKGGPAGLGQAPPVTMVSIAILPPGPFEPGMTKQLAAVALMSNGVTPDVTAMLAWSSSDESLVEMQGRGKATVHFGAGEVTITAAVRGGKASDSIDVTVKAALKEIKVGPDNPLVESGEFGQLTATAVYADGSTDNITDSVEWRSETPRVAEYLPGGSKFFKAAAAGTAKVSATDPATHVVGRGKVTVFATGRPPELKGIELEPLNPEIKGGSVPFKAIGVFAGKSRHEITDKLRWTSSRPEVLVVDETTGIARPRLMSGTSTIVATDRATGRWNSTRCFVEIEGSGRLFVQPKHVRVRHGGMAGVQVWAALKGGASVEVHDLVQWTSADETVSDYAGTPSGRVSGVKVGKTTIEVQLYEEKATFDVTVMPRELMMIDVIPVGETIQVGKTLQFAAGGRDINLMEVDLVNPFWSSSRPDRIEVDQSGLATAKAPGDVVITVQVGRISGRVEVQAVP
jgi:uncharacterized protein YjdB